MLQIYLLIQRVERRTESHALEARGSGDASLRAASVVPESRSVGILCIGAMAMPEEKTIEKGQDPGLSRARGDGELSESDAEKVSGGVPCLPPAPPGPVPIPYPNISE